MLSVFTPKEGSHTCHLCDFKGTDKEYLKRHLHRMHGKSELEKVFKKPEWNCHLCEFQSHNKGYRTLQPQYSTLDISSPRFFNLELLNPRPMVGKVFIQEGEHDKSWNNHAQTHLGLQSCGVETPYFSTLNFSTVNFSYQ